MKLEVVAATNPNKHRAAGFLVDPIFAVPPAMVSAGDQSMGNEQKSGERSVQICLYSLYITHDVNHW